MRARGRNRDRVDILARGAGAAAGTLNAAGERVVMTNVPCRITLQTTEALDPGLTQPVSAMRTRIRLGPKPMLRQGWIVRRRPSGRRYLVTNPEVHPNPDRPTHQWADLSEDTV